VLPCGPPSVTLPCAGVQHPAIASPLPTHTDNPQLTLTTGSCHNEVMGKQVETAEHQAMVARLKETRAAAIEAMQRAVELARERRRIMEALLAEGFSQADLARELGVTRQAIQKMIAVGAERREK
jgi:transcriptional regulator with GAF, ATPase, and Fis domain